VIQHAITNAKPGETDEVNSLEWLLSTRTFGNQTSHITQHLVLFEGIDIWLQKA
jgi:hypothetical protein